MFESGFCIIFFNFSGKSLHAKSEPTPIIQKDFDEPFKNNMDHHTATEQENLFKLDLQSESVDSPAEEK